MKVFNIEISTLALIVILINSCKKDADNGSLWKTYTKEAGLLNNAVTAIAADSQNNIWFGTWQGISKFNGSNWTTYKRADGLVCDTITCISVDKFDNIWFGTYGYGISKFDGSHWTTYNKTNGLNGLINAITFNKNNDVWVGSTKAVYHFNGNNWIIYNDIPEFSLQDIIVYGLAIDSDDTKWIGTFYNGLLKFDGLNWTHYTYADGLAATSNSIYTIEIDNQGNKWFSTFHEGVTNFDGTKWKIYNTTNGLAGNYVSCIATDSKGNVWFGTDNGVSKFDGVNWTTYTTSDGLAKNYILSMTIDAQDIKWFGTNGGGVSRYSGD